MTSSHFPRPTKILSPESLDHRSHRDPRVTLDRFDCFGCLPCGRRKGSLRPPQISQGRYRGVRKFVREIARGRSLCDLPFFPPTIANQRVYQCSHPRAPFVAMLMANCSREERKEKTDLRRFLFFPSLSISLSPSLPSFSRNGTRSPTQRHVNATISPEQFDRFRGGVDR